MCPSAPAAIDGPGDVLPDDGPSDGGRDAIAGARDVSDVARSDGVAPVLLSYTVRCGDVPSSAVPYFEKRLGRMRHT